MPLTCKSTLDDVLEEDFTQFDVAGLNILTKKVLSELCIYLINLPDLDPKESPPKMEDDSTINNNLPLQTLLANISEDLKEVKSLREEINTLKEVVIKSSESCHKPVSNVTLVVPANVDSVDTDKCTEPVQHYHENFISDADKSTELHDFCSKQTYRTERGHSVCSFGEQYKYSRASASSRSAPPPPIPDIMKPLINEMCDKYPGIGAEDINEVLINKFEGTESFLPFHCDDEATIAPQSSIFTVSLGESSTINFKNIHSNAEKSIEVSPNSLYVMSRRSQGSWQHGIVQSEALTGIRYSITFRFISKRFLKSTIIVGDSNTAHLKFWDKKKSEECERQWGTFGYFMPGDRLHCPRLEQINPWDCVGFSNVFVHCGVNDLKQPGARAGTVCKMLMDRVNLIRLICPRAKVNISPILPTKSASLNAKVREFNHILFDSVDELADPLVKDLNFTQFVDDRSGLLRQDLGRYKASMYDTIHIGSKGIRLLANTIRERVLGSSKVDGRAYSSVASGTYQGGSPEVVGRGGRGAGRSGGRGRGRGGGPGVVSSFSNSENSEIERRNANSGILLMEAPPSVTVPVHAPAPEVIT